MDGGGVGAFGFRTRVVEDEGCAFIPGEGGRCGAMRREGSPYCAHHHALCHLAKESRGGRRRLQEAEALASAVGGRAGRRDRLPPDPFLRRLENIARGFARPKRSCFVPEGSEK